MTIKDLLVHIDQTPGGAGPPGGGPEAGGAFRRPCHGALSHRRTVHAERRRLSPAGRRRARTPAPRGSRGRSGVRCSRRWPAEQRGVVLETRLEVGLARPVAGDSRPQRPQCRSCRGRRAGPGRTAATDEPPLVEAAFMDTGRPALVVPHVGVRALPPGRVMIAWDGSREAARAVHDALPLLRLAEDVVILIVDAGKLGAPLRSATRRRHPGPSEAS